METCNGGTLGAKKGTPVPFHQKEPEQQPFPREIGQSLSGLHGLTFSLEV